MVLEVLGVTRSKLVVKPGFRLNQFFYADIRLAPILRDLVNTIQQKRFYFASERRAIPYLEVCADVLGKNVLATSEARQTAK